MTSSIEAPGGVERRRKPPKDTLPKTSLFVAVVGVIAITMSTVVVIAAILMNDKEAPDGLIGLAGVGMGSLGTFLARGQGNT